ncbi:MAG: K(+)-transporting ATPase subunit C [Bacteroidota bacterium]|nr:K(+)-transporting ATPase subunit C [Bacteroidota bacterium]
MKENIFPAIRLTFVCLLFFSGIYTLIVFGIAQFSTNHGKGEVIRQDNKTYYANVGQKFTDDKYFNSRPSAVEYNAAGAGGSNKGPSNPGYLKDIQARIDTFLLHNPGINKSEIPSDLVTASGSGLDPNISVQAANIQVKRIARIRGVAEGNLQQLIISNTEIPLLGFLGTERINVLKLNIALDNLK